MLKWISRSFLLVSSISLLSPLTSPSWLCRFSVNSRQFSLIAARSLVILNSSKSLEINYMKSIQKTRLEDLHKQADCWLNWDWLWWEGPDNREPSLSVPCYLLGWSLTSAAPKYFPQPASRVKSPRRSYSGQHWTRHNIWRLQCLNVMLSGFIGQFTCKIW